jgi:hypothetical protein
MVAGVSASTPKFEQQGIDPLLQRLEAEVGVPVVPGEGRRWCQSVLAIVAELREDWPKHLQQQRTTLKRTLKSDVDLASRVDKLAERENDVSERLNALEKKTRGLAEEATDAEGSAEPTAPIEGLREEWLGWIVSCRAVSKEVETWFVESAYRDVGAGD